MSALSPHFAAAVGAIPKDLLSLSGKVFYSGRAAFADAVPLYLLGANPGGDPGSMQDETVGSHTEWVASAAPADWSAYRDERWKGKPPGRHGMQPRVLHMFRATGLQPGAIPASNLVFVRSRREGDIANDFERLANLCWPFHKFVLENLRPRVVLCLGKTAGDYVRAKTGAQAHFGSFIELNKRKWPSHTYRSASGLKVVVATHPSIADWTAPESDPTPLLVSALRDA